VHSLLGELAPAAESLDFKRTAQQCKLSQAAGTFEKLFHFWYLDVVDPFASQANDVVMRLHVAIIASNIVQERHLARLAHFAKLFQNPMHCGQ